MADARIAITGATGAVGGRVARSLAADGLPLRLVVRDATRAPRVEAELAEIGGYADEVGLVRALTGVSTLFLVSATESPNRVAEHRAVVESAAEAGVSRVVYLSFQGAAPDCTFTFGRDHWHTEHLLRASGMDFTFLRDSFYLAGLVDMAGADGVIRGPAGEGAVAAVAHADVAAVAAAILRDRSHLGETLDVTGPAAITLHEAAATITAVTGRTVSYVDETEAEAYASRRHFGAPPFAVEGWVSSYQAIARGEVAAVSDTVRSVTGRDPLDLESVLRGAGRETDSA